jgi:hypothetical protein
MGVISRSPGVVQDDAGAQPKPISCASASSGSAATSGIPDSDKYVDKLLRNSEPLPPIAWSNWYREVRWFNLSVIVITPLVALYGALTTRLDMRTFWFCVFYYVFNMIGGSLVCFWMNVPSSDSVGDFQGSRLVRTPAFYLYRLIVTCHRQVITVCGLTGPTMPPSPSSISSLWPAGVPSRERSGGGLVATGLTTGTSSIRSCVRHSLP